MTELRAEQLRVTAGAHRLLDDVSLTLCTGELVAVLGPNGAGKTTLLRALLGLVRRAGGTVQLDGSDLDRFAPAARARCIAYLPQRRPLAWPTSVREVVALGRYAHGAASGRLGERDRKAVAGALAACDLEALAERPTSSLSGGELARVHIARALASEAPLLLADEPLASLDPRHQLRMAAGLRRFVDAGGGALVVLHDIATAARIADRLVFLRGGRIRGEGAPADVLSAGLLAEVYEVAATVDLRAGRIDIRIEAPL
jgi:iron complex transport system ATP-binding protein